MLFKVFCELVQLQTGKNDHSQGTKFLKKLVGERRFKVLYECVFGRNRLPHLWSTALLCSETIMRWMIVRIVQLL